VAASAIVYLDSLARGLWKWRWVVAVFASFALLFVAQTAPFRSPTFHDEFEYLALADTLLRSGVFGLYGQASAARPPGYVWFVCAATWLGGGKPAVVGLQIVLWATTAILAGRIVHRLKGATAAGVTVALALGYPLFAYSALTVYPQTLTGCLLVLILSTLLDRAGTVTSFRRSIAVGFVTGILILVTPVMAPILAFGYVLFWVLGRLPMRAGIVIALTTCLMLSPWVLRNWAYLGAPTIATNGGVNLLLGNSENARPGLGVNADISRYVKQAEELSEGEADRFYRNAAIQWVRNNPYDAVRLYAGKFLQFFGFREVLATQGADASGNRLIIFVSYYPLLLLAIVGFWLEDGRTRERALLAVVYILGALIYALYFPRIRFRIPFDYILVMLAATALAATMERLLQVGGRQVTAPSQELSS
jgi:hypothetical protein